MFVARGLAVSFSVFVLVYCALSFAVCCGWRKVWLHGQKRSARLCADLLFSVRILPLATAAVLTFAFTIPSFVLLEPRAIDEPMGGIPVGLGLCGLLLLAFGVLNAAWTMLRASRTIALWTKQAMQVDSTLSVPVLRISRAVPALAAAGIMQPRVLMSAAAEFVLAPKELQTALQHELVHVRRWDNLKKLVLRFVAFPGMNGLETAWLEATEMAADDAAVASASEALDLASALIKLSRLAPLEPPAELTTSLIHSPVAVINARVERLIAWSEERVAPVQKYPSWYGLGAGVAVIAVFAVNYSQLLVRVHTATEWLVR